MKLTDEEIEEFAEIWETEFAEQLTLDEARDRAREMLDFLALRAGEDSPLFDPGEDTSDPFPA